MKISRFLTIMALSFAIVLGISSCVGNSDLSTVKDISLAGAKTEYAFGEDFTADGLTVLATFNDGSQKELKGDEYTVSLDDFNCMKPGTHQITVRVMGTSISKTYEVSVAQADKLKVLMIGNSYADDTINYAYEIAKSAGIPVQNILIADIYIGSCSLETHWENAQSGAKAYRFGLEREGWFDGDSYMNWSIDDAIMYTDWDFITLQQNSGNSGIPTTYSSLQNLMDYVLDIATDASINPNANPNVKLVWHQTWAYQQNTATDAFAPYDYDQKIMFDAIQFCLNNQVLDKDFAAVIPNGTAIQNARTSFIGDTLSRDKYNHLSYDAGRYIAAMNLVATLTGRDISSVTWKPDDSGFGVSMSDEMIAACKESVINALANYLEVTPSKYPPKPIEAPFDGKGTKEDPYLIQSADDMWKLSEMTKGIDFGDKNTYFKLTADIDLSAKNWQPICLSADLGWVSVENGNAKSFNANFDGNGKTITFVGNYTGDTWAKGLFGGIGGYVHDLTIRGSISTEKGRVGSLAAMAMTGARIENVTSYVNINAPSNNQIGGIIGYVESNNVVIDNCKNYGSITGRELVGGILGGGYTNVTFINCENHGAITASSKSAGGITGEKHSVMTLSNCNNTGKVIAAGTEATSDYGSAPNYAGYIAGIKK